jgi:hypothetical protein
MPAVEPAHARAAATAEQAPAAYEPAMQEPEPSAEPFYDYASATEPEAADEPASEAAANYDEVPDIETVDVPERVVALADDLDIPDVSFEEDKAEVPGFDDLDAEFSTLLNEMNSAEPAQPANPPASAYEDESYAPGFGEHRIDQRAYADFGEAVAPAAAAVATAAAFAAGGGRRGLDEDNLPGSRPLAGADPFAVTDDLDYDPDQDEAMAGLAERQPERRPRGRGLMIAGLVGAVAVIGGLGALALSFGGGGSSEAPAIVKADNQPIKVKPENPGGTVVPNQNNKVYDAVAKGAKPTAPTQQSLVTQQEDPVDVTAQEPAPRVVDLNGQDDQAGAQPPATAKSEDRIAPSAQGQDVASDNEAAPVVTPRKVRTMVVKPDGSLAPREDPAPAQVAAAEPADPAPQHVAAPGQPDATGTIPAAADAANSAPTDAAPALKPAAKAPSSMPKVAPIAPQRPSDQPVNVVGEVKPDQVASIDSGAAAAGSWAMQIASQPSAEAAQSTYQDLAKRYAGVLKGHTASIVKAEVAGKGTFYRVRVPAPSRNEAVALCTSYKAAGGNCFVSK